MTQNPICTCDENCDDICAVHAVEIVAELKTELKAALRSERNAIERMDEMGAKAEALEREAFTLSAGVCEHLIGDEHGHTTCKYRELESEVERLKVYEETATKTAGMLGCQLVLLPHTVRTLHTDLEAALEEIKRLEDEVESEGGQAFYSSDNRWDVRKRNRK